MAKPVCEACGVYRSECTTPVGDGAAELCWLCAHHVMEHAMRVGPELETMPCTCSRESVFPTDYLRTLDAKLAVIQKRGPFTSGAEACAALESVKGRPTKSRRRPGTPA